MIGRRASTSEQGSALSLFKMQNLLHADIANLLFIGSPDCVLPDASGKFFAHFCIANLLFIGSPDCVLPDASGKFFAHF